MLTLLLAMTLWSPDLRDGARVPSAFVWNHDGCTGENRTPRLRWSAPPRGTRTFTLRVVDHDAPKPGGWLHWSVDRIPASARALGPQLPPGATTSANDFGAPGWGGPCPPPGPMHHYTFVLTARDARGAAIATARMVPTYRR
ncbi:MAG TPA: YbhB/YbcL family Raf kinase inhibitor-like protein [Candidatus Elarobacter sp.]|jgi:hypothetical protein|nr:YbhB/YbcL family Raf kinase inhibitor-like protein [Candidatus Elarobacter sp.]